jgi:tRNA(Ile)-lysidine synthase
MNVSVEPGTYVVAVSGGVDSIVLLDLLNKKHDLKLIVAHYDHGIRGDSELDRKLVRETASGYGLQFVYDEGNLGPDASEAKAREARYKFLHKVREACGARAIITAHHEDDVLETAILNILRGTGRKGLASIKSTDLIIRPLLNIPKKQIREYAKEHNLKWREDITNLDLRHTRNFIRHRILPKFGPGDREKLSAIINKTHELNQEIEEILTSCLHIQPVINRLNRHWFIMLPHDASREVMADWLRRHHIRDFSTKTLDRLIVAAKTLANGKTADIDANHSLKIHKGVLALSTKER